MPKTSELCPNISLSVFAAQLVTGPAKGGRGGGLAAMGNPGVGRGKVYPMASEDHCSTLPCAGGNARMQSLVVKVKHYHPVPPHGICSAVGAGSNPVAEAAQEATQGQPCHIGTTTHHPGSHHCGFCVSPAVQNGKKWVSSALFFPPAALQAQVLQPWGGTRLGWGMAPGLSGICPSCPSSFAVA